MAFSLRSRGACALIISTRLPRLTWCIGPLCVSAALWLAGCVGEAGEQLPDTVLTESSCAQAGRADDIVRKAAMAEFQEFGKTCESYEIATYPQNERETVWRACCGGAGLNYIFFPAKCVARRASSLIQCKS